MVKKNENAACATDQLQTAMTINAMQIVTSLVATNRANVNDIPKLLDKIVDAFKSSAAVSGLATVESVLEQIAPSTPAPKVDAPVSVTADSEFLAQYPALCTEEESLEDTGDGKMYCIIDKKRVSFLRKHLNKTYGLKFEDYKRIYGLSEDYPSTPPKFKAAKRDTAKGQKLGHHRRAARVEATANENAVIAKAGGKATPSGRTRRTTVVSAAPQSAAA